MERIKLHIECYADDDKLAELGIEIKRNTEWRECLVPIDAIMLIYPAKQGGTMIIIGGNDFLFKESFEYVQDLLAGKDVEMDDI